MWKAVSLIVLVAGCDAASQPAPPPVASDTGPPAPSFDPVLVEALCIAALFPAGSGTGSTKAGILTNGKVRSPWIAREYDADIFEVMPLLDRNLALVAASRTGWAGLLPSSECPSALPAYASILVTHATDGDRKGIWVISGDLFAPERLFLEGDVQSARRKAVDMVKKAMGGEVIVDSVAITTDVKSTTVTGPWLDAFRAQ